MGLGVIHILRKHGIGGRGSAQCLLLLIGGEGVWKNYDYVIYVYRRGVYIFSPEETAHFNRMQTMFTVAIIVCLLGLAT